MVLYKRLDYKKREEIYKLKQSGISNKKIAKLVACNKATIGRELRRNSEADLGYLPDRAQEKAMKRKRRNSKIFRSAALNEYILGKLKLFWSPEQIAGRLEYESLEVNISHESIYQYIYSPEGIKQKLYNYLHYRMPRRRLRFTRKTKRSTIPDLVPISERPDEVSHRKDIGHWEADLIFFKRNQSQNSIVMLERKSRISTLIYNPSKHSDGTISRIEKATERFGEKVKSITFDRGREFSEHKWLNNKGIKTYFCNPYSPWQKGSVENMNWRIRRFLPKNFNPQDLSQKVLDQVEDILNNTPRKCLGFLTPNEAFFNDCS